jgi:hypothetical protein
MSSTSFRHCFPAIEDRVRDGILEDTKEARLEAARNIEHRSTGNPNMRAYSFYNESQLDTWAQGVQIFSHMGFPFTKVKLREMMQSAVREILERRRVESGGKQDWIDDLKGNGGDIPEFGDKFMQR